MTAPQLAAYLGFAALYAAAITAVVLIVLRLFRSRPGGAAILLMLTTLFFVTLALTPFPDRATLDCSAGTQMQLQPFRFLPAFSRLIRTGAGPMAWIGNLTVASTIMNYAICIVIGAALSGVTGRWGLAALVAAGLTLGIETTQVTGNWGIYPCAYRLFDVDDLILNFAGVMTGFAAMRGVRAVRGTPRRGPAGPAAQAPQHSPDPRDRPS